MSKLLIENLRIKRNLPKVVVHLFSNYAFVPKVSFCIIITLIFTFANTAKCQDPKYRDAEKAKIMKALCVLFNDSNLKKYKDTNSIFYACLPYYHIATNQVRCIDSLYLNYFTYLNTDVIWQMDDSTKLVFGSLELDDFVEKNNKPILLFTHNCRFEKDVYDIELRILKYDLKDEVTLDCNQYKIYMSDTMKAVRTINYSITYPKSLGENFAWYFGIPFDVNCRQISH